MKEKVIRIDVLGWEVTRSGVNMSRNLTKGHTLFSWLQPDPSNPGEYIGGVRHGIANALHEVLPPFVLKHVKDTWPSDFQIDPIDQLADDMFDKDCE